MTEAIQAVTMPKWGLAMTEGMVAAWHVEEGSEIAAGDEILDIETTKITNAFEAPAAGVLRRQVVAEGETVPVGALLAVVAGADLSDADIDAFIADFEANFDAEAAAAAEGGGPEPEVVEAGGRRLRYLKAGDGDATPTLLLHGFGGDFNSWMFNQPALAQDRAVFALDLPGHGGSEKEVGPGDVAALAAAATDFMDAAGIERAHMAGHSLGGAVALAIALDDPTRVASLTLVCPAGLGPDINMDYIEGFIAAGRRKQLKPVLEQLFADPELVSRDMMEDIIKYKRLDGAVAALQAIAGAAFAGGRQATVMSDQVGAVSAPVQVIWGTQDRIVPAAHADSLPAQVEVHRFDDAGHMVHMEKAADVNQLISAFIA
ncbi:MAG: acetoin dehydrogenase dihydrolipoyllysine-residue acetyltransferase subunit [Minwuiales bacterium]|nr:acetoin dehydrogenase dihydrolipoyllysine-residue acetyltransferase subunit [Minwuiales bacterium]